MKSITKVQKKGHTKVIHISKASLIVSTHFSWDQKKRKRRLLQWGKVRMSKNFVDTFLVLFILNILLITFGRTKTLRKEILTARPVFDVFPTGTWHKSHRDIRIFDTFRLEQILINNWDKYWILFAIKFNFDWDSKNQCLRQISFTILTGTQKEIDHECHLDRIFWIFPIIYLFWDHKRVKCQGVL